LARRVVNNVEELIEVEATIIATKVVLAKGTSVVITTTTTIVVVQDGINSAPKLDEFGSDVNLQKRLESKRRARVREC
jgi:hypothetical protein